MSKFLLSVARQRKGGEHGSARTVGQKIGRARVGQAPPCLSARRPLGRLGTAHSRNSSVVQPTFQSQGCVQLPTPSQHCSPTLASDRWQQVDAVLKRRRLELVPQHLTPDIAHGRFLIYFPDVDLGTTAALTESDGFFDAHTAPPWGTWIGFFEERNNRTAHASYLLAWVPGELQACASRAMHASAEECIQWMTDVNVELRTILEGLFTESTNVRAPVGASKGRSPQRNQRQTAGCDSVAALAGVRL